MRAGRVSQSPGEAQGYSGGGRSLGARRPSLYFASGSPKDPAQVPGAFRGSQARGSAGREAPASCPGDRAAPLPGPGVLEALLSGNACGGHCQGPGYPPASRPSDIFSIKRDVIIKAVTPLHAVLGQPKVTFRQPPCPRWVVLFIYMGRGEGRGKRRSPPDRCGHRGTPDLPSTLQGPPAGRGPAYWVVETVSSQWRSTPFSHRMMLCACV